MNGTYCIAKPANEPVFGYAPGSREKLELKARLAELSNSKLELPLLIGGREVRTGKLGTCVMPHDHRHVLAEYHQAGPKELAEATAAALQAKAAWESTPWEHRAAVFLKAADLISGPWRATLNAATMLGQSKTVFQAEVDAACELADFMRFNAWYMGEIYRDQPPVSPTGTWNRIDYRPLEGFILAITPFNFTSIGGNLPSAPAMLGNTVVWKPSSTAVYSNYFIAKILQEAGLPDGVINFVPCQASALPGTVLADEWLAGIHFTGSTEVFQTLFQQVANNIGRYRTYPRLVGETGGKDFIFAHRSADVDALAAGIIRGAFEYQGQKCSAASRGYVPASISSALLGKLRTEIASMKVGDVEDFTNFMGAVIDRKSFDNIRSYLAFVQDSPDAKIVIGGGCDDTEGYFVQPTVVVTTDPKFRTMQEEIFGPVMTLYVYPDEKLAEALALCDETSPYGLTGAIFAGERSAIVEMETALRNSVGNFYINDKPTGAVVGQQPFGGARKSGTNDKAGARVNLQRWVSPRAIKETFNPPRDWRYPFMNEA
jgi:1-pyrroline-5-carboxylate dehydrogenase